MSGLGVGAATRSEGNSAKHQRTKRCHRRNECPPRGEVGHGACAPGGLCDCGCAMRSRSALSPYLLHSKFKSGDEQSKMLFGKNTLRQYPFSKRRAMQAKATIAIFAGAFLASCANTSGILGTDVGRQMVNSSATTPELIMRDAVFLQVKEQDTRQAVRTLENDGAICSDSVCSWSFIHHETWFETLGARMPGPRRSSKRIWTVSFVSDRILHKSDIVTGVEIESVQ